MAIHTSCACPACAGPVERLTAALVDLFDRRGWDNSNNAANKIARGYRYGSAEAMASIPREFHERNQVEPGELARAISRVLTASRGVLHNLR